MISGHIALNHPLLNVRPEFRAVAERPQSGQTMIFDVADQVDLGDVLGKAADINLQAAHQLKESISTYTKSKASGNTDFKALETGRKSVTRAWVDLKGMAENSLKTVSTLASAASSYLGPVILGSCEHLAEGVEKVQFYPQTSKEHLINYGSGLEALTGDGYSNSLSTSISGGEVTTNTPFFDPSTPPTGTMLVDSKMGIAVLFDQRPKE